MSLRTVWNSQSQDITYQGELLSGSEVCVGLAPHHLMFEITAHATQKAVSKRNFFNKFVRHYAKEIFVFLACLLDMEGKGCHPM